MRRPTKRARRLLAGAAVTTTFLAAAWHLLGSRGDLASLLVSAMIAGGAGLLAANRLGGAFLLLAGAVGSMTALHREAFPDWLMLAGALGFVGYLALLGAMIRADALATALLTLLAATLGATAVVASPGAAAACPCVMYPGPREARLAPPEESSLIPARISEVLAEARAPLDGETVKNPDFEAGRAWARADAAHGSLALRGVNLQLGEDANRRYAMILGHRFGVALDPRSGCPSAPKRPSEAFRKAYNGSMSIAIEAHYGPMVWREAGRLARELARERIAALACPH